MVTRPRASHVRMNRITLALKSTSVSKACQIVLIHELTELVAGVCEGASVTKLAVTKACLAHLRQAPRLASLWLVAKLAKAYRRHLEFPAVPPNRRILGLLEILAVPSNRRILGRTEAALTAALTALAAFGASRAPVPAALTASVMTAILIVALAAFGASQAQAPPAASVITAILTVAQAPARAPARAPPAPVALTCAAASRWRARNNSRIQSYMHRL